MVTSQETTQVPTREVSETGGATTARRAGSTGDERPQARAGVYTVELNRTATTEEDHDRHRRADTHTVQ